MRPRAVLAALATAGLTACSTPTGVGEPSVAPEASETQETITISGFMTVHGEGDSADGRVGQVCSVGGGYSDIRVGAQVVVTDAIGKTIGLGELGQGKLELDDSGVWDARRCVFPFAVTDVPAGEAFYGVEVSHRGRLQYTAAQVGQYLKMSLGG